MRSEAPALLPIFRSQAQAEILALLLLHPEQEFNLTDLSRRIKAPLTSIHREVERLVEAAMLAERPGGRNRMVRANLDHPASATHQTARTELRSRARRGRRVRKDPRSQ